MKTAFKTKRLLVASAVVIFTTALGLFLLLGPPQLLAKSESPAFCASCHVMKPQYEAYMHNGAHRLPIPVKSATHSSRSRPGIPVEAGHLFR